MAVQEFYFFGSYNSCPIEATTYLDLIGITSPTVREAYCNLISYYKSNGVYSKILDFKPMIGDSAVKNKWNAVNLVDSDGAFRSTFGGGVTFSLLGEQGNGANGYNDTHLIPSVEFTALGGGGMTLFMNSERAFSTNADAGSFDAGKYFSIYAKYTGNNFYGVPNTANVFPVTNMSSIGTFSTFRETGNSTQHITRLNGVNSVFTSVFDPPNYSNMLHCSSENGAPSYFTDARKSGYIAYKNVTTADVAIIENGMQIFNTAIGR